MTGEQTDGTHRDGFHLDVDWLLSGVIQLSVGAAAAAFFGQIWAEWTLTFFLWGILAVRIVRRSVSLEYKSGKEQLVFSWPWR